MNQYKVNPACMALTWYICASSQRHTERYFVYGKDDALNDLYKECGWIIDTVNKKCHTQLNDTDIKGLANVCLVLQACDSYAYTFHGITRRLSDSVYHYNANKTFTRTYDGAIEKLKREIEKV